MPRVEPASSLKLVGSAGRAGLIDVVDLRRHVLWKIIQRNCVDHRLRASGVENDFPLRVASRGDGHLGSLTRRRLASTGCSCDPDCRRCRCVQEDRHCHCHGNRRAPSAKKSSHRKHRSRKNPGSPVRDREQKPCRDYYLTAYRAPLGALAKLGDLRRRRIQQIFVTFRAIDCVDVAAVPGSGEQLVTRIECQGIDDIVVRCPDAGRRSILCDR